MHQDNHNMLPVYNALAEQDPPFQENTKKWLTLPTSISHTDMHQ